jgi:predicted nucleic acid-binding protein
LREVKPRARTVDAVDVLRSVIDAMVFDAIAAEPELPAQLDRLTRAGRIELLAAAATLQEVAATPDRAHRRRLQRVRVLAVPPPDPRDPAAAALTAALCAAPGVSDEDAAVAVAAAAHHVPLVTEDRDLRAAVVAELPHVPLWSWPELRARMAAELPA